MRSRALVYAAEQARWRTRYRRYLAGRGVPAYVVSGLKTLDELRGFALWLARRK